MRVRRGCFRAETNPSWRPKIHSAPYLSENKMKTLKNCLTASALIAVVLMSSGCSTLSSAYDSTVDTVSGWFGNGEKKAD